jgi:hypothetical protein
LLESIHKTGAFANPAGAVALELLCVTLARGHLVKAGLYRRQRKFRLACVFDENPRHARLRWAAPAGRAKRLDGVRRAGKKRFDIAIKAVSDPAGNPEAICFHLHPYAIADSLNPAFYDNMDDFSFLRHGGR